jgi:hypothetical protein
MVFVMEVAEQPTCSGFGRAPDPIKREKLDARLSAWSVSVAIAR